MSNNGGYALFSHGPFLCNLEIDPAESYDQTKTHPEVARDFAEVLDAWEAGTNANLRGWL